MLVKLPSLSRKPWLTPSLLLHTPTISPRSLMPSPSVSTAPGTSIELRTYPPLTFISAVFRCGKPPWRTKHRYDEKYRRLTLFSSARRVRWKKTSLDPHPGSSRCAGGFQSSLQAGMAQNLFRAACRRSNAPPCNHWLLRGMGMARKPCVPVASVYHPTIAPP